MIPASATSFYTFLNSKYIDSIGMFSTDVHEIISIVSNFKNKLSCGYDDIPVNIMKASIHPIAEVISNVINSSLLTGIYPDQLKIAKICPIFKSGERDLFVNYRPISVLSSFSKIFEKVMFNRLINYIDSKKILINSPFGFRQKHSTFMAISDMYDKISAAIDRNEYAIGIFIDLSKAFDTLDHEILLKKLEHYGVRGVALQWFKSYLVNRKQYVFVNETSSLLRTITCGVPQGSILGPLLFILYINDIVCCSDILQFILFADDTNLFYSNSNVNKLVEVLNCELSKLTKWFQVNKLSLNVQKTNFIAFGHKKFAYNHNLNIILDGVSIERVKFTKFLGAYIDEKLTWKNHINHVKIKISKGLGIMSRVRNFLPHNVMLMLYYTLIHPYLSYCNIIWGSATFTV